MAAAPAHLIFVQHLRQNFPFRLLNVIKFVETMAQLQTPAVNPVLEALKQQYEFIDGEAMPHVAQLVEHEIYKLTQESMMKGPPPNPDYLDLSNEKNRIKISHNVIIPIERYPGYNFVGKLLGNKGENLKKLCTETNTRMAILGRGSTKEKSKEDELLESGLPEYQHIREPLHVRVESHGPFKQVWTNMAAAMDALAPYMKPDDTYVPPAPPQWRGWGYNEGAGMYGAQMGGRGGARGRGEGRGAFPRGRGRGGGMGRGGGRGGGGYGFGDDGMYCGGMEDDSMEYMEADHSAYSNGFGHSQNPAYGKMMPRGGPSGGRGSGNMRAFSRPRGQSRRPY